MTDLPRPTAARLGRPRWLDARLVAGVLLVLTSVVVGAKVIAEADDSYAVWALRHDIGPRAVLGPGDLVSRQVRLEGDASAYIAATGPAPAGWTLTRPVGAGELLPRAALAAPGTVPTRRVAVGVEPVVAADLADGTVVDVYVVTGGGGRPGTAGTSAAGKASVERVLRGVTVARVERGGRGGLGGSGANASVVLILRADAPPGETDDVTTFLRAQARGDIKLVALPQGARS